MMINDKSTMTSTIKAPNIIVNKSRLGTSDAQFILSFN